MVRLNVTIVILSLLLGCEDITIEPKTEPAVTGEIQFNLTQSKKA